MQDPELDRQNADIVQLKAMWQLFMEYFKLGLTGDAPSASNEAKFLEVKSNIAMLHDSLLAAVKGDRQVAQNIMLLVGRCITLRHIGRMTDSDIKKIRIEWNEALIMLDSEISELEQKRAKLAELNPYVYYFNRVRTRVVAKVWNFIGSTGFKATAILAGVSFGIYAFMMLGGAKFMYDTPALRPVYYFGETFYREFINSSHPYDTIDRMWSRMGSLPFNYEWVTNPDFVVQRAVLERELDNPVRAPQPLGLGAKLRELSEANFKAQGLRYDAKGGPGGGTLEVYTYLFDQTYKTKDIMREISNWRNTLDDANRGTFNSKFRFFRMVNCIVILRGGGDIIKDNFSKDTLRGQERL